jgi:diguanylate cyclase (GGDEF)-like protein
VQDPLTRLANRILFVQRTNQALATLRESADVTAVLFLDLDRFKVVNDSLGHAAGDALLVDVAARLSSAARRTDVVARFGGDEFAVLCERLPGRAEAATVAERISQALAEPFRHAGQEIHVSASIGIAIAETAGRDPGDDERGRGAAIDADSLLRDADAAMYQVKSRNRGSGGYQFFNDTVRKRAVSRLAIETQLRAALERREFRLAFEPVYTLRERRVVGAEALLRWQHPERGLLAPAEFVEVAEDCGLMVPIGSWVLDEACRRLASWNRKRAADGAPTERAPTMAVNLSVRQISDPGFVDEVDAVVDRYKLSPHQLCLEITETAVHDAPLSTSTVLKGLSALGVRIALDDFGTGYSSLRHLRRVPVDVLKIDRMFVSDLGHTGEDRAIVAAVIGMARALGMTTIGEGIETAEQYQQLRELGCDEGQGFLLAAPMTADEFQATHLDR